MKKFFSLLLVLIMSLSLFAGCGGDGISGSGGSSSSSDSGRDPDSIVINLDPNISADIEISVPGGNKNEETMISCLIEEFALMYPNVNIDMNFFSVDNLVYNVTQSAIAGNLSDIIWNNSPDFYEIVDADIIEDLTPYIKASEKAGNFNYENDFYTEFFDMGAYNGKNYVIPRSCDSIVTFYNTDLFQKANIDMTKVKNGWTWDDFLEVCAQMRSYMDTHGMSSSYVIDANLTSWLSVCYPLLVSYGAEVIDVNGNTAIDSPETKACLEMIRDMVEKRYIIDSNVQTTQSFENGGSAMIFQSASVSIYAEKMALKNKVDLVSFPLVNVKENPKIGAGIAGYSITKQSKNKDVAWAFLQFLLSHDGQQEMALNGLNLASIRKDLSDPETANWGQKYKTLNLSAYTWGSEYKTSTDFFVRTKLSAKAYIQQAITEMVNNACNKEKDLDKAIKTAVANINDAIEGY